MNVNELAFSLRWRQPGGIIALLFILGTFSPATGQTSLDVHVTNIAIASGLSARGLTAAFPHPVLAAITVTDDNGNPVSGLADTSRWLAPRDLAEAGLPVAQIWKRLLEYHRDAPSFPSNPDIYQQNPAPLLTEFRQTTPFPTSTMLVMDVSGSMSEELADAKSAARLFVDLLRPIDRAGVVQFSHTIAAFQEFTNDKQKLLAIIDSAKADGATALYDALVYAVQATRRENTRRAIIVYTDGVDISSTLTPTAVIDSARFYSTPIFTIALGTGTNPDTLKRIAKETGGLFFQTRDAVEFKTIYQRIAALIQNFYMLAYSSPDPVRNGTWRRLEVTVCDERTRLGTSTGDYFVPGGPPLRDTDLTPALTSFTDLTILENGKPVKAVRPGDQYTYRLRVRNHGPERAESVRLNQLLPPAVNFIGATNLPFYTTRDSLVWQIARLDAGATDSITVTAQFAANAPPTVQQLISRLTSSAHNDNTPNNNTARDTVRASFATPPTFTDLAVTQFVRTDSFVVSGNDTVYFAGSGGTINYRVVVTNLGLIAARNVRVTDFLPDSVRASNFQPSPAGANADSVLWTIASLPSQSSASFTFNATVAPKMPVGTNLLINQATVKADNEDPAKLANNTSIDTVFNINKPPAIADLALNLNSRTNSTIVENGRIVNTVKPGEPIDYKIRVRNLGPELANSIRVRQLLPDSVRFVAASKPLAITSRDSLIWQIPQLASGGVDSITISVLFAARVPPTLTQLISRANLTSPNDISPANNAASDTVRVIIPPRLTDLAITLNSRTNSAIIENNRIINAAKPGEPIDYKIRVQNLGPEQAPDIRVRQLFPDSVRFVAASKPLAISSRDSLIWQIPLLNAGGVDSITVSVLFAARVPPTLTRLISRANLIFANEIAPANNSASDTIRVVIPPLLTDLAMTLNSRTNSTIVENGRIVNAVKPGEPIDYKIRVRNLGPELANSIRVRQLFPDSVRFVAASKPLAIINRDSLIWQIPALASGGVDSITISVLFAARVPPTLTQLISRANLTSPNDISPANNAASDTVRVIIPPRLTDLAITLNSRTNSAIIENNRIINAAKPGEPIDYKIRVQNLGPEQAPDIRVRQLFPDSVRFVAASKPLAISSRDSLIWQIPLLNAGGIDSITVSVLFASRVPPTLTRLISRANLIFANEIAPANNSATDTVRVVIPPAITELALALNSRTNSTIVENGKIVNAVKPGEPIDYKIRVRNLGPELANSIRVRQLLPDSVRFVAASKPLAIINRDSLIWQIPQLASGGVDSITISVLFAARVPPTLTRLISRANLTSPNDNSLANNSASDTVRVVIPPPLPPTDLAVTLTSQTGLTLFENGRFVNAAKPGQRYDYRLRMRNLGPARAENIRLRQSLPDSVRFVAASQPPALATRDSLIWEITSLNAGGSDSINVTVQFAPSVPQNLARLISRLTLFAANDNSPNNNVARDTVRVVIPPPPGSRPLIEARPPEVTVGDSVRVRVQVLAPVAAWDLWVYYANGQVDSSYADAYIKTTRLTPNVWFDVKPIFTNTRLFTSAKEEDIRFEIRSLDIFGDFATASAAVLVRSSNDLLLDRNVYEADLQSPLGINFRLSSNREARLEVYDLNGVCITKLVQAPFNAGWNTYNWNGQTETGRPVGSGVYIIALRSGEFNAWKKCIIVR